MYALGCIYAGYGVFFPIDDNLVVCGAAILNRLSLLIAEIYIHRQFSAELLNLIQRGISGSFRQRARKQHSCNQNRQQDTQ